MSGICGEVYPPMTDWNSPDLNLTASDRFVANYLCDSWEALMAHREHEQWVRDFAQRQREPGEEG